jgi:NAD+ kinase
MTIGLFPNISKGDVVEVVVKIINYIKENKLEFVLSDNLIPLKEKLSVERDKIEFYSPEEIGNKCDMLISIGGDGTMLHTAYSVRNSATPILGVNFGKLGFLAEFDLNTVGEFLKGVNEKKYRVEERMTLSGSCNNCSDQLYAINDLVIDKGPWTKMIELTILIDDIYVTTFSADGIIVATPTGSTGYSLSTGGPIVSPGADVITLSPIAPHTLTMRPLVISSKQKITIKADSPHEKIQISCDGQRVNYYQPPAVITIEKCSKPVRLVHMNSNNYFETLRKKLFWGLDVRKMTNE